MLIELQYEYLQMLFDILLKDKNTDKNIIWGTNDYRKLGMEYSADCEITYDSLINLDSEFLQPRVTKSKEVQKGRTKDKAEVFTPSWICEFMNNYCEKDWFNKNNKRFDSDLNMVSKEFLKSYVDVKKLEITCGEAPFVVSRYDTTTGNIIPLYNRIGFLDKKLTAICHYIDNMDEWFEWVCRAYQSCYGYEYQGDNLFKARLNLIHTFLDYYEKKWVRGFPTNVQLRKISNIIMRNFWQMDGLSYTAPNTDIKCKVYNWRSKKNMNLTGEGIMKFDFVVGNPPYQGEQQGDSNSTMPIYHEFMESTYKIGEKVLLITPARFLFNAGRTPKQWNEKMLNDGHFSVVKYEDNSKKVFSGVDIKGGVAITYYDNTKDGVPIRIFTKYLEVNSILKKVASELNAESIGDLIYVSSKFNLNTLGKDYSDYKNRERRLSSNVLSLDCFTDDKRSENDIRIYGVIKNKRTSKYIDCKYIDTEVGNIKGYKVILPKADGVGNFGEIVTNPEVISKNSGYTHTFYGIGNFNTLYEAECVLKYVKTKFVRVLLSVLKVTQNVNADTWALVPIQDFTENSDIDWSVSISEVDKQLYKKYGLDDKEIAFIEEKVKGME